MHDRVASRRRILKTGQILFGSSAVDCVVRDISEGGARLVVQSPLWFPDKFVLSIRTEDVVRHCHIVWRRSGQIGVAFDAPKATLG